MITSEQLVSLGQRRQSAMNLLMTSPSGRLSARGGSIARRQYIGTGACLMMATPS
jgi:hypothetical protein